MIITRAANVIRWHERSKLRSSSHPTVRSYLGFYLLGYNAVQSVKSQSKVSEEHVASTFRVEE
jgi:hypothetical protein